MKSILALLFLCAGVFSFTLVEATAPERVDRKPVVLEEEVEITKDILEGTFLDNLGQRNFDSTSCVDAYGIVCPELIIVLEGEVEITRELPPGVPFDPLSNWNLGYDSRQPTVEP